MYMNSWLIKNKLYNAASYKQLMMHKNLISTKDKKKINNKYLSQIYNIASYIAI